MKTTEEKVALVTGKGMKIGLASAEAFACAGYITVLADIHKPKMQAEKLAAEGLWLCSPQASYMNGQGLIVDEGITVK